MIHLVLNCARQQTAAAEFDTPACSFSATTSTVSGREVLAKISGKLRQPSGPSVGSPADFTSGFISTSGMNSLTLAGLPFSSKVDGRFSTWRTSTTVTYTASPMCCAARPMP